MFFLFYFQAEMNAYKDENVSQFVSRQSKECQKDAGDKCGHEKRRLTSRLKSSLRANNSDRV